MTEAEINEHRKCCIFQHPGGCSEGTHLVLSRLRSPQGVESDIKEGEKGGKSLKLKDHQSPPDPQTLKVLENIIRQ